MKIDGILTGQYTYGEDYPPDNVGRSVNFELYLTSQGAEFEGNFSDDETKDVFSNQGTVSGFIEDNHISFTKQYPKCWYFNEANERIIVEDQIAPSIHYEGLLAGDRFEGTWEIHQHYIGDEGPYSEILGTGTWTMNAESKLSQ